jgi:hypothetical protein
MDLPFDPLPIFGSNVLGWIMGIVMGIVIRHDGNEMAKCVERGNGNRAEIEC